MKLRVPFLALVLALVAGRAYAQSETSRVIGVVTDVSGGALPGVTVTASGAAASPASIVTDDTGRYVSPALPPGVYVVTFELAGFESRRVTAEGGARRSGNPRIRLRPPVAADLQPHDWARRLRSRC